jgi:ubiquinone/menaquinone biosynthesis C-methylase UbiE
VRCAGCASRWPLAGDLPRLYRDAWIRGNDRLLSPFYDHLPRLHDPAVRFLLPLWQLEGREEAMRAHYIARLDLGGPDLRAAPRPRLLEVSVGTGVNVGLVRRASPPDLALDYWGLELSAGMLGLACERLRGGEAGALRLVQGDAHALPFADASFDRVLHVGGIGGFRDPALALRELLRVAKPGARIVVVDEQLDPARRHGPWPRAWFRALTFYDDDPRSPRHLLPADACDVAETQASRFYYCLSFRRTAG